MIFFLHFVTAGSINRMWAVTLAEKPKALC
jgi:hypothetical protein